jgi:hypothetical protein
MSALHSLEKLFANRANAQKSTGPKTEDGKAKVAQNATRHGLASHGLIVTEADRDHFSEVEAELRADVVPKGALEETAFKHLLMHRWNIIRVQKAELALLDQANGEDPLTNPETRKTSELYLRYTQRFESAYRSAYKHLEKLQTERAIRGHLDLECSPDLPKTAEIKEMQRVAEQSHRVDCAPIRKELLLNNVLLRRAEATLKSCAAAEKGMPGFPSEEDRARFEEFFAAYANEGVK